MAGVFERCSAVRATEGTNLLPCIPGGANRGLSIRE